MPTVTTFLNVVIASIIRHLVRTEHRLGPNQQARLDSINTKLSNWYEERPGSHRLPTLKLSNLQQTSRWSQLHGRAVKAANTRAAVPFVAELAAEFYSPDDEYGRLSIRCARMLARFYEAVYAAGAVLTDAQLEEVRRIVRIFGASFQQLRNLSQTMAFLGWNITPKTHYFMHLPSSCALVNARFTHCYMDESAVGTITKIWSRSARGRYRRTIQRVVLLKRLVALFVRLETGVV